MIPLDLPEEDQARLANTRPAKIKAWLQEALQATEAERADLATARIVKRRLADIDSGKASTKSWADVKAGLGLQAAVRCQLLRVI